MTGRTPPPPQPPRWRGLVHDAHTYGGLAIAAAGAEQLRQGLGLLVFGGGLIAFFFVGVFRSDRQAAAQAAKRPTEET